MKRDAFMPEEVTMDVVFSVAGTMRVILSTLCSSESKAVFIVAVSRWDMACVPLHLEAL